MKKIILLTFLMICPLLLFATGNVNVTIINNTSTIQKVEITPPDLSTFAQCNSIFYIPPRSINTYDLEMDYTNQQSLFVDSCELACDVVNPQTGYFVRWDYPVSPYAKSEVYLSGDKEDTRNSPCYDSNRNIISYVTMNDSIEGNVPNAHYDLTITLTDNK